MPNVLYNLILILAECRYEVWTIRTLTLVTLVGLFVAAPNCNFSFVVCCYLCVDNGWVAARPQLPLRAKPSVWKNKCDCFPPLMSRRDLTWSSHPPAHEYLWIVVQCFEELVRLKRCTWRQVNLPCAVFEQASTTQAANPLFHQGSWVNKQLFAGIVRTTLQVMGFPFISVVGGVKGSQSRPLL